jgi:hypothetical protein
MPRHALAAAASLAVASLLFASAASAEQTPRRGPDDYKWNIRFNPINLLLGRASGAVDYGLIGPLSIGVLPTYVFSKPVYRSDPYDVSGWGLAGQLALWIDTRPFRGLAIKLHVEHETTKYTVTDAANNQSSRTFNMNKVGALLASQSIHGGWFTFSTGIGIVKDLSWNKEDHTITCPGGDASTQCDVASGLGRGWDLLGEIAIGVVF